MAASCPDSDILQLWVLSPILSADYVDLKNPGLGYTKSYWDVKSGTSLHHFYLVPASSCPPVISPHSPSMPSFEEASTAVVAQGLASRLSDRGWSSLDPCSLFDSHCCLNLLFNQFNLVPGVHNARLLEGPNINGEDLAGKFGGCIATSCDPREWAAGPLRTQVSGWVLRADREDRVYLSVGVHPRFASLFSSSEFAQLERLVRGGARGLRRVVAMGDCGLDYSVTNPVSRSSQRRVFFDQLVLGMKYNLPLVLYIRDAEEDGYQILEAAGVPSDYQLHRHCFTGAWSTARAWLDKYPSSKIGVSGFITSPGSAPFQHAVRQIPLHRLLLETDAPPLLPAGVDRHLYQSPMSQPGRLIHVAAKVAQLKNVSVREVLAANWRSVTEIYGIILCP